MKVMFVDDEIMILKGLKRAFFRNKWQMLFADSADKALKILAQEPVDFIISDMRMPGMNGAELLEEVAILHPHIVRIILSGHSDEEAAKKASFVAHQWFNKPCQPEILEQVLNHIYLIRRSLPNPNVQQVVGKIKTLPSPPKVYMSLNASLNDETVDMQKIARIIAEQPALVAKILQLTNTSFFSNGKQVESLTEAITRLGIDLVCCIVIAAETYAKIDDIPGYSIEEEQNHCLSTARLAASMVEPSLRRETILVGLLHNIGKFILYEVSPQAMSVYIEKRIVGADNIELEQQLFDADHTQLAGYLLHLWNFSYKLIENIVLHHQPLKLSQGDFGSGAAVYIASRLLRKQKVDQTFIEHFDIADKVELWKDKATDY
ncbi:HDOD domain-containing protein [Colwellia psychrerythraea]|uniref:Response regulator receiver modulated metal dependent hydrolase n=1 Tax=Colwellia psychrerythraea TaxID=28229 RepID=A0A099KHM2_COLPS|nr:HDOD domain-containing protein [Colwellia psychrerythraea]KGJ89861.1 response regulator receiver modulated metal dependent hydrolase [Colwellia psychrerythraea]